jgi:Acetyltransferases, including N-acetylases of ribosomal proteins
MTQHKEITLRPFKVADLPIWWALSYSPQANLEWMKWNGPYFQDPVLSWQEFLEGFGGASIELPDRQGIFLDGNLVGMVSAYYEDGDLSRWLEVGIVLYDATIWGQGVGRQALTQWLTFLFKRYPLPHIGLSTWSGNERMMALGERVGMQQEARIRQVRYVNGQYYDAIKYGVLREEWEQHEN